jgi:hypothetical protein
MLADAVETLGPAALRERNEFAVFFFLMRRMAGDVADDSAFAQFPWATTLFGCETNSFCRNFPFHSRRHRSLTAAVALS